MDACMQGWVEWEDVKSSGHPKRLIVPTHTATMLSRVPLDIELAPSISQSLCQTEAKSGLVSSLKATGRKRRIIVEKTQMPVEFSLALDHPSITSANSTSSINYRSEMNETHRLLGYEKQCEALSTQKKPPVLPSRAITNYI